MLREDCGTRSAEMKFPASLRRRLQRRGYCAEVTGKFCATAETLRDGRTRNDFLQVMTPSLRRRGRLLNPKFFENERTHVRCYEVHGGPPVVFSHSLGP